MQVVSNGMTIDLKDARANLVRGHMRISLGKKGSMKESETSLESIKESVNLSDLEYEMPRFGNRVEADVEEEVAAEALLVAGVF